MNDLKQYDIVIIGGGPAGLSAGIYTSRARLSTLIIEKGAVGGQIINTEVVENYPGYAQGISGIELTQMMYEQATRFGAETLVAEVNALETAGGEKTVRTSGGDFKARAVIIAGGAVRQKLGVPGEDKFAGKGVSYCATCDGAFFRDKVLAVVGGGDTAVTEALELSRFASKVYLIHRRNELRATPILQEKIKTEPKIEILWETVIEEITGGTFVEKINTGNTKTGAKATLEVSGVFVSVGSLPATGYLKGVLDIDKNGAIVTSEKLETSLPGVFAAGDIRSGSIRQVIGAAGDGATAAINADKYISEK